MTRPCFLVIDREFPGSISTRKLVIETAKFNVLTAYSGTEALKTFERFPNISGIVLDAGVNDISCSALVKELKTRTPDLPLVVICPPGDARCDGADHYLESFDPRQLLAILQNLVPEKAAVIEAHEELLARNESRKSSTSPE